MTGFLDAWKSFLKNAFTFEGRSTRAAFWWVILGIGAVSLAITTLANGGTLFTRADGQPMTSMQTVMALAFVLGVPLLLPLLSLTVRRFHDAGLSPWILAGLVVIPLGLFISLYFASSGALNSSAVTDSALVSLFAVNDFLPYLAIAAVLVVACIPSRFSKYLKYPMDEI